MKAETIIRTVLLIVALINQTLIMSGKNPLPWGEDEMYLFLSNAFTLGAAAWAWWKNNSFTRAAQKADVYMAELKEACDEQRYI